MSFKTKTHTAICQQLKIIIWKIWILTKNVILHLDFLIESTEKINHAPFVIFFFFIVVDLNPEFLKPC